MLTNLTKVLLCLALAVAVSGCPKNPDGTDTPAQKTAKADLEQGKENLKEAIEDTGETARDLGEQALETTKQAGEAIKEGYANFTDDVKEKYPKVVESMQKNFDAMKKNAEEEYLSTLAPDAPRRDQLIAEFKAAAPLKRSYTLETFTVESASDTVAVAKVVMVSKNSDPAQPVEDKHASYRYTFHRAADGDQWYVYDIEPLDETAKQAESK